MYIAVRIAFNIIFNKEAAEKEDELIEYILDDVLEEDEVYCNDEIKERLLLQSNMDAVHVRIGAWNHGKNHN
jgi:hypothetical protein